MDIKQAATLLVAINKQANGTTAITPTDTASFVSVGQTVLKSGYDKVCGAISQVLAKTVFSVRPYNRKFPGLVKTAQQYGNHVRKLQVVDADPAEDESIQLSNGPVDHYALHKPNVLQTNFYGESVFQRAVTIYKHQLDVAFSSPEEFMAFVSMVIQNAVDLMEKDHENIARLTLANLIAGKKACDAGNVIHLVTEYNAVTGMELTPEAIRKAENFAPFIKWAMGRIRGVSQMLTERTTKYHFNIDGKPISRHTPIEKQKVFITAADAFGMESEVMSGVFHDEYLKKVDYEIVNFWQAIDSPAKISVKPSYLNAAGEVVKATEAVEVDNIFGVVFDEEAAGYTVVNQWAASTPLNAAGGYSNTYWHFTDRYWNDFTENAVAFCLD